MTTIALNIIVGPGEASLLNRCLTSFCAKEMFDEIVIVNTSLDSNIDIVAKKYNANVLYFKWETEDNPYGNFGGARDFARKNTVSDKFMWLDTDDVLLPEYKENYIKMHEFIRNKDYSDMVVWRLPYVLIHSEKGKIDTYFWRERIFDTKTIHWERPVHEMTYPYYHMVKNAQINNVFISHATTKTPFDSSARNIKILKHEYEKDTTDVQTKYFLGRDSLITDDDNQAIYGMKLLDEILSDMDTGSEMLYSTSIELARMLAYGSSNPRPKIDDFRKENILNVESYCRIALSHSNIYPEPYIYLGDIYFFQNKIDHAIKMWLTALKKNDKDGKWKSVPLSTEVPCDRLSMAYHIKGQYGIAAHYSMQAISYSESVEYYNRLIHSTNEINKKINDYVKNNS